MKRIRQQADVDAVPRTACAARSGAGLYRGLFAAPGIARVWVSKGAKPARGETVRRAGVITLLAFLVSTALASGAARAGRSAAAAVPIQKIADVPLGGRTTRLDYASLDPSRHLLFVAHLGDSQVIVFDVQASRVVGRVAGVSSVHGVLALPELNRVYATATATGTGEVVAIDPATLTVIARVPTGGYPDGLAYAPGSHKLYVSDEKAGNEAVIDVRSNTRIATIALGGEAGNTQYDSITGHIFVNAQTRNQLVEIDPASDKIIARYDLPGAQRNHGLLIDPEHRLAFIACEGNDTLIAFDMRTMRPLASFPVGSGPDVIAYDPVFKYLYVASEAGPVSVFRVATGSVKKLGDEFIGPNAHVVAVDPATHRVYFPLKNLNGHTAMRIFEAIDRQVDHVRL
jgi:YVTN family beta-propeller protein